MATKIQLRRDTSANWEGTNPILAQGEPGVELDTKKMKVGDGIRSWNDLDYVASGTSENSTTNMFVKLDGIDGDIDPDWSGVVSVSTDGLNWTPSTFNQKQTDAEGWDIYHLAVGNGRIVYHTYDYGSDRDELRWAYNPFDKPNLPQGTGSDASRRGPNGEDINWLNVRYVEDKFVAVGYYYDDARDDDYYYPIAAYSTDGDSWTRINIDLDYCHTLIQDERSVTSFGVNGLMMEDVAYGDNGWLFVTHWGPSDTTGGGTGYAKAFYVTDLTTQLGSANAVSGIPGAYTVKYDGKGWVTWSSYDAPTGNSSILYINSSSDPRSGTWTQVDMDTVATELTGITSGYITDVVAGTVNGVHWMMVGTESHGSFASNDGGATWRFIQTGAEVSNIRAVSDTNPAYITSYYSSSISSNTGEKVTIAGSRISQLNGTFYIRRYNGPDGYQNYLYSDAAFQQPLDASSWGDTNLYTTVSIEVRYGDHTAIVDNASTLRVGMVAEGYDYGNDSGFNTYEDYWSNIDDPNVITAINGNVITMKYPWNRDNTTVNYEFGPVLYNTYGDGITSMAYGDGAFIGFSNNNGYRAYRTTNMTSWTKTTSGNRPQNVLNNWDTNYLNSVAYGTVTTPASTLINNSETIPGYASYLTVGDTFKVSVTGGDPEWTRSNLTEGYSTGGIEIDPALSQWQIGVIQDVEGFFSGPDYLGIGTYSTEGYTYGTNVHDSITVLTPNYNWSFDDYIGAFSSENLDINNNNNMYIYTDYGKAHINSPFDGYEDDTGIYGYNSNNGYGEGYAALSFDSDVNFVKVDYYGVDIYSGSDENNYYDARWYFRNDCNGDNWGVLYQPDSAGIQTAGYWWIGDYQDDWENTYIRATNWLDPNPVDIMFSAEGSYGSAFYVMGRDGVLSVPYGDGVFQSEGYWAIGDYTYYDDSYAHIGDKSHTYVAAADNIANTPIPATALVSGLTYVITTVGNTDWTNANARNDVPSQVDTVFVYDGTALTGTGYAKLAGHDIEIAANDTYFYFNRTGTFELPAGGDIVDSSGNSVLNRDMPQTLLDGASDYTVTLNDRGGHLYVVSAGDILIPTNASVAFPIGTTITVVTDGSHNTRIKAVDSGTTTLVLSKTGPANTVTGVAVSADTYVTMLKVAAERWMVQVA
jgi:hypothetical protein